MPAPYKGGGPGNELRHVAQLFEGVTPAMVKELKPVFKKAAQNTKTVWQENLRQSEWWRTIAQTVSYDDLSDGNLIKFEVGTPGSQRRTTPRGPRPRLKNGKLGRRPGGDPKNSGGLTHIAMGYTSRGGGHRTDPIVFMETEAEQLEKHVDDVITKVLQGL